MFLYVNKTTSYTCTWWNGSLIDSFFKKIWNQNPELEIYMTEHKADIANSQFI